MGSLKVDFLESGKGDTILITFPSGGVGIVDAHPSAQGSRADILEFVRGKKIHFVCLTHPHSDHGKDLPKVLNQHPSVDSFWHTSSRVKQFLYFLEQAPNYLSPVKDFVSQMNYEEAEFMSRIYDAAANPKIKRHLLRAENKPVTIDGVNIHCLGPTEQVQNEFDDSLEKMIRNPTTEEPDVNLLSAIIGLEYGQKLILLGADAKKSNWDTALRLHSKRKLPKASVIKIPHHGAKNSFNFSKKGSSYLDLCERNPDAISVLFAGDSTHPNEKVFQEMISKTQSICATNGRVGVKSNPLNINILSARAISDPIVCNPIVSIQLDSQGAVTVLNGHFCKAKCLA